MNDGTGPGETGRPAGPRILTEGGVDFVSPGVCATERGPGTRSGPSFYNKAMAPNRDLAEAVAAVLARRFRAARSDGPPFRVLDGMASSGVRGLRFIRRSVELLAGGTRPPGAAAAGEPERGAAGMKEPGDGNGAVPGGGDGAPAGPAVIVTLNDIDPGVARCAILNVEGLDLAFGGGSPDGGPGSGSEAHPPYFARSFPGRVRAEVTSRDVRSLLGENRYNYSDIDPYGTPSPFIPAALAALFRGGVAGFTATDTAALCGVYPRTALRRYGARTFKSHLQHEMGCRILAGACVRAAASMDLGCRPVLAQSTDHFMRVYIRMEGRAEAADSIMSEMGFLLMDRVTGRMWTRSTDDISQGRGFGDGDKTPPGRGTSVLTAIWGDGENGGRELTVENILSRDGAGGTHVAGPLWLGGLFEPALVRELQQETESPPRGGGSGAEPEKARRNLARWLDVARGEAGAPPFFYDIDRLCSLLSISPPKKLAIGEAFESAGHSFAYTTFSPVGFKTGAPYGEVLKTMKALAARR